MPAATGTIMPAASSTTTPEARNGEQSSLYSMGLYRQGLRNSIARLFDYANASHSEMDDWLEEPEAGPSHG